MSDNDKDKQASDDLDADFDEPSSESEQKTDPATDDRIDQQPAPDIVITKKGGASASIAWLALFLSLLTVAGVGYLYIEKFRAETQADQEGSAVTALSDRLEETTQSLAGLDSNVSDLAMAESRANSMIRSLQNDLDGRSQLFDTLPPRMTRLERSVASLQGVSLDTRNTYLVAEAEYYIQIANSQLQLAGNPYLASLALRQADDRLLQLADPALTDVRRTIAHEIAALEVMDKPDIAGVTLTLASLARVVESLPLRQQSEAGAASIDEAGEDAGGATRAWNAVKGAASGLVRHTPPTDEKAPLLTPNAEPLIRSNLSLQLQTARLALLRSEQVIFEQSLDDADAWLDTYFDASSEPVESARATLAKIRDEYAVSAPPDISGSLRLLRQYKTLADSDKNVARPGATVSEPDTSAAQPDEVITEPDTEAAQPDEIIAEPEPDTGAAQPDEVSAEPEPDSGVAQPDEVSAEPVE